MFAPRRVLAAPKTTASSLLRESFLNASVFLLLGSLLIGITVIQLQRLSRMEFKTAK